MKKIYLAVLTCVALAWRVSAQSDVTRAKWKSAAIVIDGNDEEWNKPLNLYDDKRGILYAIANDKNTLYFDFAASDPMKMRKMMSAGWSIDLISKEKGNKFKASVIFPEIKMPGGRTRRSGEQMGERNQDNPAIKGYEMMLQTVDLRGFRANQAQVPVRNKSGIDVAVGENAQKQLVCEIAIPLTELFGKNTIQLNEPMTLNVFVNGLSRPAEGGGAGGGFESGMGGSGKGGGRMGGGMRGGGGGEMRRMEGGPRGGEGMGDRSGMFGKTSFKQKFKLTDN